MKSGLKKTLLVTGIITLVLVVLWALAFVLQGLFHQGDFITNLQNQIEPIKTYFSSWNGEEWQSLFAMDGYLGETIGLIVLVVVIILSIVLACVGRRGWVVLPLIAFIVLAVGIWETRIDAGYLVDVILGREIPDDLIIYEFNQLGFYYYLGMLAVYLLGVISTCIFWIASLDATMLKREGSVKAFINEESIDAEFEGDIEPEYAGSIEAEPAIETEEVEAAPTVTATTTNPSTSDELVALLKQVVRDIVRDEVARTNANAGEAPAGDTLAPSTGVTFGGPLVVQYFNGPTPCSKPCEEKKEEDKCECLGETLSGEEKSSPVVVQIYNQEPEEKTAPAPEIISEPEPVVEAVEEPKPATPKPAPAPKPAKAAPAPKPKIVRIPFQTRILDADEEMKSNYNALKNNILSYGVKSRVSNSGDTFRLHRKTYVKITIAGKSLKLYFALNPADYQESTIPVQDAGDKGIYADIPLVFKVKSALSLRRAYTLIAEVMERDDLEQGEIGDVDWVKDILINGASDED